MSVNVHKINRPCQSNGNRLAVLSNLLRPAQTRMDYAYCQITPEAAQWILDNLNSRNRREKEYKQGQMVADINSGRWLPTHEGLAFAEDGSLFDGQNRLRSVVKAGKPINLWVCFNVPLESVPGINIGTSRSVADGARLAGKEWMTSTITAIGRRMFDPMDYVSGNLSHGQIVELCERHREAIEFATRHLNYKTKGFAAPLKACIARAWYSADRNRLARFCEILLLGIEADPNADEDQAAMKCREFLLGDKTNNRTGAVRLYKRVQGMLRAFLDRRRIQRILEVDEDLFPLPPEREQNQ